MKHIVKFEPDYHGLYYPYVDDKRIHLLLAHHQVLKTLELIEQFKDWENDNDYFYMLIAGACKIAMYDKE